MVAGCSGVLLWSQVHGRTDQVGRRVDTGGRVTRETAAEEQEGGAEVIGGR